MNNYLHLCFKLWLNAGLRYVIVSPGSRSAPLVRAVVESRNFETLVIPDERSAAFVALGIAQASKSPVALVCTSGTAVYNYAPAVAEAFFTNTPLILLTADRPPEWINQDDGQTIFQNGIFGKHVVGSFQMPVSVKTEDDYLICSRIAKESISIVVRGPVHINCPFREPLYLNNETTLNIPKHWFQMTPNLDNYTSLELNKKYLEHLIQAKKVLIIIGQKDRNKKFIQYLSEVKKHLYIVCVADILSNCHGIFPHYVFNSKNLICDATNNVLMPDLVITFGKSLLSKPLKKWFRYVNIEDHWIFDTNSNVAKSTFNSKYTHFNVDDDVGLSMILNTLKEQNNLDPSYHLEWNKFVISKENIKPNEENCLVDKNVIMAVLSSISNDFHVHVGNSMPVRYLSAIGCLNDTITFYANRGTCGIDGSVSTAMGQAMTIGGKHLLIIGDMSFFYDRNAWWHKHRPKYFKVLLINNSGGGVFDFIVKNTTNKMKKKYFITAQNMCAAHLASEYNIDYCLVKKMDNYRVLVDRISTWLNDDKSKISILEVKTLMSNNIEDCNIF